jgi:excisionase family DNA binding protein
MSEEPLLTPEQIAKRLQVKERTVYSWLRSGQLRGVKLGRLWRVRPADFEAFLERAVPGSETTKC